MHLYTTIQKLTKNVFGVLRSHLFRSDATYAYALFIYIVFDDGDGSGDRSSVLPLSLIIFPLYF